MVYEYLIERNGYFYYCGASGSAPKAIRNAVAKAFVKCGGMSEEGAHKKIDELQISGHYNLECW